MNKINSAILRPYDFFVATFRQVSADTPELISVNYNTFSVIPEFSISGNGGKYHVEIINTEELGISENDSVAVNAEINYCNSGQTNKIEAFLSEDHRIINIINVFLEYADLQDIDGQFVVYIYKYF